MEGEPRVDPEIADLVETLTSYGVLTRDALFERSGASSWSGPDFGAALRRGVENGSIKELGEGLFEVGEDPPDLSNARFNPS